MLSLVTLNKHVIKKTGLPVLLTGKLSRKKHNAYFRAVARLAYHAFEPANPLVGNDLDIGFGKYRVFTTVHGPKTRFSVKIVDEMHDRMQDGVEGFTVINEEVHISQQPAYICVKDENVDLMFSMLDYHSKFLHDTPGLYNRLQREIYENEGAVIKFT